MPQEIAFEVSGILIIFASLMAAYGIGTVACIIWTAKKFRELQTIGTFRIRGVSDVILLVMSALNFGLVLPCGILLGAITGFAQHPARLNRYIYER